MKAVRSLLSLLAVAGGLGIAASVGAAVSSGAEAATLPNLSIPSTDVTPAHCRSFYHCHEVCKRRWYGRKKCREYCHRC
jgi:hypothetical protein